MIPISLNPMGRNKGRGRLPAGYIELEYLESTGTQYIDTGIVPDDLTGLWELSSKRLQAEDYVSSGTRSASVRFYGYCAAYSLEVNYGRGVYYYTGYRIANWDDYCDYKHNYRNSREITANSHVLASNIITISGITSNIIMFGYSTGATTNVTKCRSRIKYLKLTQGQKLVRNFIPALDPTGRPCMFDLVTRRPYYNKGTGEFLWRLKKDTLPSVYSRAYSVYFDGATYVNTGITPTAAPLYRTDIRAVVNTSRTSLIGAAGSVPYSFIGLRADSTIYAGTSSGYGGNVPYSEKRCIWEFAADGAYVDNTKVFAGGVTGGSKWIIMGCYWGGYYETKGTFYSLTLRNSANELVAQYIPVRNNDTDEYLLWETVSGTPVAATKGQILGYQP